MIHVGGSIIRSRLPGRVSSCLVSMTFANRTIKLLSDPEVMIPNLLLRPLIPFLSAF